MYWEATVNAEEFFANCKTQSCLEAWSERTAGVVSVLSTADADSAMKAAAGAVDVTVDAVVEVKGDNNVAVLLIFLIYFTIQVYTIYRVARIGGEFGVDLEMVTDVAGVGAGDAAVDNVVDETADDVVLGCVGDASVDNEVDGTADDVVLGCAAVNSVVDGTTNDVVLGCAAVNNVVDGTTNDVVSSCAGDPVDVEPSMADSEREMVENTLHGYDGVVDDVAPSVVGTGAVALAELKLATKLVLGEGGFGVVYLVEHKRRHEQLYALKLLNENESTLCFAREKKIQGMCDHPNILKVHDIKGKWIMLMDFVQGGELSSYLRYHNKCKGIPEKDAAFYAGQLILALEYLDKLDIVHRDLKPDNLLIDLRGYLQQ